jgi:hypothetical protein
MSGGFRRPLEGPVSADPYTRELLTLDNEINFRISLLFVIRQFLVTGYWLLRSVHTSLCCSLLVCGAE